MTKQAPIFILHDYFCETIEKITGHDLPDEVKDKITIDLPPRHIKADFTFSVFETAKYLEQDYSDLAHKIKERLSMENKYIKDVDVFNGFLNIKLRPESFYHDSLKYILESNLVTNNKKRNEHSVLLVTDQPNLKSGQIILFVKNLYQSYFYDFATESLDKNISENFTRDFLENLTDNKRVSDLGNNVIVVPFLDGRNILLQKQNKTLTPILSQLAILDFYKRTHKPTMVIFSIDQPPSSINDFLQIVKHLKIFDEYTNLIVLPDADIDNIVNSYLIKRLTSICNKINKSLAEVEKSSSHMSQFTTEEEPILRLLSYAPEAFKRAVTIASPKPIISYIEFCQNYKELFYSYAKRLKIEHNESHIFLLRATYKILNDYLQLFKK
jgi:hypothetical protein